jgi:hypothetical protein
MAKRPKYRPEDFPKAGTVFVTPLGNNRVGVCRVVRFLSQGGDAGSPSALIAVSDWISESAPSLTDPAIRRILILNHHSWKAKPATIWVHEPPPTTFTILGHIEVLEEDSGLQCNSYGGWEGTARQALLQWRWDNDREAVLAEDVVKKAAEVSKQAEKQRARAAYLSSVSFTDILAKPLFPTWEEFPPQAAKEGSERIILLLIHTLAEHHGPLDRAFVLKHLEECVENLNDFDAQNNNFIETVEREDLVLLLEEILSAAKHPDLVDEIDNWRDW